MSNEIDDLIEGLSSADGVTRACRRAEEWAASGSIGEILTLATALEERAPKTELAVIESLADHIEDQVALAPGAAAIDAVLALSLGDRTRTVRVPRPRDVRLRAFASRLGFAHGPEALSEALARHAQRPEHAEILACWVHEAVLRGLEVSEDPRVVAFGAELARRGHPLASLPLKRLPIEAEAPSYLPLYGAEGLGEAIDTLARGVASAKTLPPPAEGVAVDVKRREDHAIEARLATAVRPWSDAPNGKLEAKVFELSPALDLAAFGAWLLRVLPLDATLDEAGRLARFGVESSLPSAVFGALFSAASNGGAYSGGLGGAYGRLAAWTSLGALVGAPVGSDVADVARLASEAAMLLFRGPQAWFHDVAWDLGVLCVRPDGASAAVLAATDKD